MKELNRSTYRCIIVDDDPGFVYLLSYYLSLVPKLPLFDTFHDPKLAMKIFWGRMQ